MEGTTTLIKAKQIFDRNFIGLDELKLIYSRMGIFIPGNDINQLPAIPFAEKFLSEVAPDHILILGIPFFKDKSPLTLVKMREHFGWNPEESEPCFYNQDWYLKESFANGCFIKNQWYLIKKQVIEDSRGILPDIYRQNKKPTLPVSLLCAYTFFACYLLNNQILWEKDYVWCSDKDHSGDQIYVGRYHDPSGINKTGFSIHRYLKINQSYGIVNTIDHD